MTSWAAGPEGPYLVSRNLTAPLRLELSEEGREVRLGDRPVSAGYAWLGDTRTLSLVVSE